MTTIHNLDTLNEPIAEDNIHGLYFFPYIQNSKENICREINKTINSISKEYLWHKDEFKVYLPLNQQSYEDLPVYLASITSFGDNIEDEWFIIHIVLELTRKYKDLIVYLKDCDGDFLLIESADHLPPWANPETTENRIFVCNNHIHLISPDLASLDEKLTLKDAVKLILQYPEKTRASADIEKAILNRIGNYPDKIKENTHIAAVNVPLELATVLQLKPNLIAPIVNAYCYQDMIDAKACKSILYENWTTVTVKFTKCLYSMLMYSKQSNQRKNLDNDKRMVLGIKLTHGFQMIMNKSADIYSSKEYSKFFNNLKDNGYFKNNIEGSKEYKTLLQNAKDFFSTVECPTSSNVANEITQMMNSDEYIKTKKTLQKDKVLELAEDNDDWLTINPEELNNLLNSRYGKKTKFQKGDAITADALTSELNSFLKETSQFEGIETNNEQQPDNSIDFDPDEFVNCVEKMLKLISSNNEVESIESDFSDDIMSQSEDEEELDKELKERLHGAEENLNDNKTILENIIKSMKEEKASAGPSSSLISNLGLNKIDLLDSDDD